MISYDSGIPPLINKNNSKQICLTKTSKILLESSVTKVLTDKNALFQQFSDQNLKPLHHDHPVGYFSKNIFSIEAPNIVTHIISGLYDQIKEFLKNECSRKDEDIALMIPDDLANIIEHYEYMKTCFNTYNASQAYKKRFSVVRNPNPYTLKQDFINDALGPYLKEIFDSLYQGIYCYQPILKTDVNKNNIHSYQEKSDSNIKLNLDFLNDTSSLNIYFMNNIIEKITDQDYGSSFWFHPAYFDHPLNFCLSPAAASISLTNHKLTSLKKDEFESFYHKASLPRMTYVSFTGVYSEIDIDILNATSDNVQIIMLYDYKTGGPTLLDATNINNYDFRAGTQYKNDSKNVLFLPIDTASSNKFDQKVIYPNEILYIFENIIVPAIKNFGPDFVCFNHSFIFHKTNPSPFYLDLYTLGKITSLLSNLCEKRFLFHPFKIPHRKDLELTKTVEFAENFFKKSFPEKLPFVRQRMLYVYTNYGQKFNKIYLREAYTVCLEAMSGIRKFTREKLRAPDETINPFFLRTLEAWARIYKDHLKFNFLAERAFQYSSTFNKLLYQKLLLSKNWNIDYLNYRQSRMINIEGSMEYVTYSSDLKQTNTRGLLLRNKIPFYMKNCKICKNCISKKSCSNEIVWLDTEKYFFVMEEISQYYIDYENQMLCIINALLIKQNEKMIRNDLFKNQKQNAIFSTSDSRSSPSKSFQEENLNPQTYKSFITHFNFKNVAGKEEFTIELDINEAFKLVFPSLEEIGLEYKPHSQEENLSQILNVSYNKKTGQLSAKERENKETTFDDSSKPKNDYLLIGAGITVFRNNLFLSYGMISLPDDKQVRSSCVIVFSLPNVIDPNDQANYSSTNQASSRSSTRPSSKPSSKMQEETKQQINERIGIILRTKTGEQRPRQFARTSVNSCAFKYKDLEHLLLYGGENPNKNDFYDIYNCIEVYTYPSFENFQKDQTCNYTIINSKEFIKNHQIFYISMTNSFTVCHDDKIYFLGGYGLNSSVNEWYFHAYRLSLSSKVDEWAITDFKFMVNEFENFDKSRYSWNDMTSVADTDKNMFYDQKNGTVVILFKSNLRVYKSVYKLSSEKISTCIINDNIGYYKNLRLSEENIENVQRENEIENNKNEEEKVEKLVDLSVPKGNERSNDPTKDTTLDTKAYTDYTSDVKVVDEKSIPISVCTDPNSTLPTTNPEENEIILIKNFFNFDNEAVKSKPRIVYLNEIKKKLDLIEKEKVIVNHKDFIEEIKSKMDKFPAFQNDSDSSSRFNAFNLTSLLSTNGAPFNPNTIQEQKSKSIPGDQTNNFGKRALVTSQDDTTNVIQRKNYPLLGSLYIQIRMGDQLEEGIMNGQDSESITIDLGSRIIFYNRLMKGIVSPLEIEKEPKEPKEQKEPTELKEPIYLFYLKLFDQDQKIQVSFQNSPRSVCFFKKKFYAYIDQDFLETNHIQDYRFESMLVEGEPKGSEIHFKNYISLKKQNGLSKRSIQVTNNFVYLFGGCSITPKSIKPTKASSKILQVDRKKISNFLDDIDNEPLNELEEKGVNQVSAFDGKYLYICCNTSPKYLEVYTEECQPKRTIVLKKFLNTEGKLVHLTLIKLKGDVVLLAIFYDKIDAEFAEIEPYIFKYVDPKTLELKDLNLRPRDEPDSRVEFDESLLYFTGRETFSITDVENVTDKLIMRRFENQKIKYYEFYPVA